MTHLCNSSMKSFIGTQDLPAQIDYILQQTNQTELSLLGHSQGTTTGMILLSERPEYNDKIKIFHAMGPTVILKHYNPLFFPFAAFHRQILVRHSAIASFWFYEFNSMGWKNASNRRKSFDCSDPCRIISKQMKCGTCSHVTRSNEMPEFSD